MKCRGCGREVRDDVMFCEWCGTSMSLPAVESSQTVLKAKTPFPTPLYLVIIGIAMIAVGGVIYAVAWSETLNHMWDDPMNPDVGSFGEFFDLTMASYIIMAIGTVLLFVGMILLVMNE